MKEEWEKAQKEVEEEERRYYEEVGNCQEECDFDDTVPQSLSPPFVSAVCAVVGVSDSVLQQCHFCLLKENHIIWVLTDPTWAVGRTH